MKKGFKETPVGMIPEDWKVIRLGDVFVRSPEYGAGSSAIPFSDKTYRYVRITDINEAGRLIEENRVGITKEDGAQYLLHEKDILIARTGNTVGKSYFHKSINGDCAFAGYLIRFKIDETKFNPTLFFHFLHSSSYWTWVKTTLRTGAQPNINSQEYQGLKLPLPPLPEQSKIASILSTVDDKIDSISKRIEETKKLKQGLIQRLLTQGIGQSKFKDSPLGRIPEGWEVVLLDNLGVFSKGKGISKNQLSLSGYPCIRYGEIYTNHDTVIREYFSFISPKIAEESYKIQKNDILFAGSGETAEDIGKAVVFIGDEEVYAGGDIIVFSPQGINSIFLSYCLNSNLVIKQRM